MSRAFGLLRDLARRIGLDIRRFPGPEHLEYYLRNRKIMGVLDVGGNEGQYGSSLRNAGFKGKIVSIEPLSGAIAMLERRAVADGHWTYHQFALGAMTGEAEIKVGKGTTFSSLLESNESARELNLLSVPDRIEKIKVKRLDDVFSSFELPSGSPLLLQIDTQGLRNPGASWRGEDAFHVRHDPVGDERATTVRGTASLS